MRARSLPIPTDEDILSQDNVPVEMAARYLGSGSNTLYEALQEERVPFGWAVRRSGHWAYNISPGALVRYKREGLPMYKLADIQAILADEVVRLVDSKLGAINKIIGLAVQA